MRFLQSRKTKMERSRTELSEIMKDVIRLLQGFIRIRNPLETKKEFNLEKNV